MSAPSFAQLFRRSRYSRFGPSGEDEQNQQRLEIFAVAAVGFALRHDIQFKKNFLKKFAGIEEEVEKYKLSLQDAHCADLALKNDDRRILVVFEFKVGASLENHQNPWFGTRKPDDNALPFWSEAKDDKNGYGYELGKNYGEFSTIYYIVVQQNERRRDETACEKFGKTFWLKSRSWNSLLEPNTELEKDLVTSLSELGIRELEDWRMKEIKIENEDLEGLFKGKNAIEIILHISAKLGLRKDFASNKLLWFFTEGSRGNSRQLGIYVPKEAMKMLGEIRASCLRDAWYGYLSENTQPFSAEVWFYGNENAQPKLRALIETELNSALVQENPEDKNGLRIIRSSETPLGDFEWFCKVLGIK